ncbi:PREDICTED: butyrophilin subfamily 3 member A3-like isoform X2 [Chinchilla lanigera]|uniref:butyrophilin subfamily 3 member A3-like isoform X2 n=1 Tax=Chinchilla lanigera TaxID=34839 RepID=UPI00069878C6|nr:PREDICTED: butyrophilin subfamily 3 member A3-like isoform X2 [Chinchilla lanigera]
MQRRAPSFRPLLLWLLLPWPGAGQFQVKGPGSPVTARVGEAAVLPCHLSPPEDAQDMEIRWYRDHQSVLVHEYRDSRDHTEQQSPEYQGRTELLRENITQGQVALRIHPIYLEDEGEYSCVFVRYTQLSQAQVELHVTASGATPNIHIQPAHTGSLTLTCSSSGWYPDPELQWRDPQGRSLSPDSVKMSVRGDGLIHVESSVTVEESSRADVSCAVQNPVLREEKEVHLSLAERIAKEHDRTAEELERRKLFIKKCLKEARQFAEDIVLAEDTAHPQLWVSDDGKRVECRSRKRAVPETPARFTFLQAVLGWNSFSSGCRYWEVLVGGNNMWTIGLCSDSVNRAAQFEDIHPENGFWTISRIDDNYQALSLPRYHFEVLAPPLIVGIFLQYEQGLISFYEVKHFTILHTFTAKFTQNLRPCFLTGLPSLGHYPRLFIPTVPPPDELGPL